MQPTLTVDIALTPPWKKIRDVTPYTFDFENNSDSSDVEELDADDYSSGTEACSGGSRRSRASTATTVVEDYYQDERDIASYQELLKKHNLATPSTNTLPHQLTVRTEDDDDEKYHSSECENNDEIKSISPSGGSNVTFMDNSAWSPVDKRRAPKTPFASSARSHRRVLSDNRQRLVLSPSASHVKCSTPNPSPKFRSQDTFVKNRLSPSANQLKVRNPAIRSPAHIRHHSKQMKAKAHKRVATAYTQSLVEGSSGNTPAAAPGSTKFRFCGELMKKSSGNIFNGWKKRWLSLIGNTLFWLKSEDSLSPLGFIKLTTVHPDAISISESGEIEIKTKAKVWHLKSVDGGSPDDPSTAEWYRVLRQMTQTFLENETRLEGTDNGRSAALQRAKVEQSLLAHSESPESRSFFTGEVFSKYKYRRSHKRWIRVSPEETSIIWSTDRLGPAKGSLELGSVYGVLRECRGSKSPWGITLMGENNSLALECSSAQQQKVWLHYLEATVHNLRQAQNKCVFTTAATAAAAAVYLKAAK
jgi:hypothetical protein